MSHIQNWKLACDLNPHRPQYTSSLEKMIKLDVKAYLSLNTTAVIMAEGVWVCSFHFQGTSSFLGTKFVILPFMDTFFFSPSGVSMMTHWAFCGLKMNNSHQTLRDLRNIIQVSQTLFHAFYHPHPHPRHLLYWPISSKAASITAAPFSMVAIRMSWPGQSTNDTCLKNKETLNFGQELFLLFLRLRHFQQ